MSQDPSQQNPSQQDDQRDQECWIPGKNVTLVDFFQAMADAWRVTDLGASVILAPVLLSDGTSTIATFRRDRRAPPDDISHLSSSFLPPMRTSLSNLFLRLSRMHLTTIVLEALADGPSERVTICQNVRILWPEERLPVVRARFRPEGVQIEAYHGSPDDMVFVGSFGATRVTLPIGYHSLVGTCNPFTEGELEGAPLTEEFYGHFHQWVLDAYRQAAMAFGQKGFAVLLPARAEGAFPIGVWAYQGPGWEPRRIAFLKDSAALEQLLEETGLSPG